MNTQTKTMNMTGKELAEEFNNLFFNTGGNDPFELISREGVTLFNNAPVALMQTSIEGQLGMIRNLRKAHRIIPEGAIDTLVAVEDSFYNEDPSKKLFEALQHINAYVVGKTM